MHPYILQPGTKEPEVVIRLTSEKTKKQNTVRYDFVSGMYQLVAEEDPVFDILTLPSRSVHRDDATFMDLNPPVIQSLGNVPSVLIHSYMNMVAITRYWEYYFILR